jgi:hypothetical protein
MDDSARLFLCARCFVQVLLCSHCDRGQRYCGRECSGLTRRQLRGQASQRYQCSPGGSLAHKMRSRRWRARQLALGRAAAQHPADGHAADQLDEGRADETVTHQGCTDVAADAPLAACQIVIDSITVGPVSVSAQAIDPFEIMVLALAAPDTGTALSAPPAGGPAELAPRGWTCRRCARPVRYLVRQGFIRTARTLRGGPSHDHSP